MLANSGKGSVEAVLRVLPPRVLAAAALHPRSYLR